MPDLTTMRRDYDEGSFSEDTLADTWLAQFQRWFDDAVAADLPEPNAMVLATADPDGAPDARVVLLKGLSDDGFVFVTNAGSAKGRQLTDDDRVALVFPWHALQRQVRVTGTATPLDDAGSDALWDPRPRGAQLAAAATVQSSTVGSRDELVTAFRELEERTEGKLPRPAGWGGYRVRPRTVEFWQGGHDRLHDRLRFTRTDAGWSVDRLAP
ncbi:Pyridoxamine 5'-phosphate oxidase [Klenkia soli]|uniref:Pyridoxine/pyridoxamine 5'-phosphate oxidase n=1 Tax=Klenkia soli TaxID=1052260 RepID=A0A1H0JEI8_9ACTN|nr:pyridoxamine 5'-phosphate oxidase [Klenkia soli]SDO42002.1 Pyridoxamine 5'-phosphate oxidase [Klenkia soli]